MCEQFNLKVAYSFFPAGPTWRSTRGTRDFVLCSIGIFKRIGACTVERDIDQTFTDGKITLNFLLNPHCVYLLKVLSSQTEIVVGKTVWLAALKLLLQSPWIRPVVSSTLSARLLDDSVLKSSFCSFEFFSTVRAFVNSSTSAINSLRNFEVKGSAAGSCKTCKCATSVPAMPVGDAVEISPPMLT